MVARTALAALVFGVVAALPTASQAEIIGVNLTGMNQTSLDATDTTGVVPQANWNNAANASGTLAGLVDATAASTGASLTYSGSGTWASGSGTASANLKLYDGYIDTIPTSTPSLSTFTFSSLPSAAYNVIIYSMGDHNDRPASFSVNGSPSIYLVGDNALTATQFAASFVRATATSLGGAGETGNYVEFDNVSSAGGITIVATPQNFRAAINGIQLVAASVPEPATLGLIAVAALGLLIRRR